MREIKFRAWDKEDKRIREFGNIPIEVKRSSTIWLDEILEKAKERYILLPYIGKRDKNKKKIYLGSIMKELNIGYDGEKDYFIYWEVKFGETPEGRYGYYLKNRDDDLIFSEDFEKLEICGDIYTNPELIYGKS